MYVSIVCRLIEQLTDMFKVPPGWDIKHEYNIKNINVYFEGKKDRSIHTVDIQLTLGEILQDKR